jgi:uncharacterized protein (TIGR00369 family)
MPASPWLATSSGVISGGVLAMLADIAFGCAVQTQLPAATPYTTAELSLSFLRPLHPGATVSAHGQAIHVGRSVALSEAFIIDGEERLIGHGTSRLSVFPQVSGIPDPPAELPPFQGLQPDDPYLRPAPVDPIPQEVWDKRSGLEVLRGQLSGELPPPPIHHLTGIRPVAVEEGKATFAMPSSEWLASPTGRLQGGTIVMLADFAMIAAAETLREPGVATAGLDVKVNFLRPVEPDGADLVGAAEVIHRGRTLAITSATVANSEGKNVALATGSSMYLPGRPASLRDEELPGGPN